MTTGERIRERRKELQLTHEQLAKKVGVQKAAVNKWEKGIVVNIKRDMIAKLCTCLDCSPSWLLGWEDEDAHAAAVREAEDLLSQLSDDQLQIVLSLLKQLSEAR